MQTDPGLRTTKLIVYLGSQLHVNVDRCVGFFTVRWNPANGLQWGRRQPILSRLGCAVGARATCIPYNSSSIRDPMLLHVHVERCRRRVVTQPLLGDPISLRQGSMDPSRLRPPTSLARLPSLTLQCIYLIAGAGSSRLSRVRRTLARPARHYPIQ